MKKKLRGWKCQYLIGYQLIDFERMRQNERFGRHNNYYIDRALSSQRLGPLPGLTSDTAREQYATVNKGSDQALRLIITIAMWDYATEDEQVATVDSLDYGSPSETRMLHIHRQIEADRKAGRGGNIQALIAIKRAYRASRDTDDTI